jgi:hypothetical protein
MLFRAPAETFRSSAWGNPPLSCHCNCIYNTVDGIVDLLQPWRLHGCILDSGLSLHVKEGWAENHVLTCEPPSGKGERMRTGLVFMCCCACERHVRGLRLTKAVNLHWVVGCTQRSRSRSVATLTSGSAHTHSSSTSSTCTASPSRPSKCSTWKPYSSKSSSSSSVSVSSGAAQ